MTSTPQTSRRNLLRGAALTAGVAGLPFASLATRSEGATAASAVFSDAGYGPLLPAIDRATGLQLISLPRGFEYLSYGWTNDLMSDGTPTPSAHDGMGAYRLGDPVHIVRNHERNPSAAFTQPAYNPLGGGGTSTIVFDPEAGAFTESWGSLGGTVRNCAGGVTPWGTWLTCEETFSEAGGMRHGYVFEVPPTGKGNPAPYKAMGRFNHEAAAIDPATGIVYETEDRGDACMYRFVPTTPGKLADGGRLQALAIGAVGVDTRAAGSGTAFGSVHWVDIDEPDPANDTVRREAQGKGAAIFSRLEGAWYGNGRIYVITTDGGPARRGPGLRARPGHRRADRALRLAERRGAQRARQHVREPARRPGAL
ncbi:PhoX family protein [Nocardioides sp. B-3]|uniref:PhoX family protein n=1 Tax=Nocardioides sp. B-3 TaxID=2895565 RepID=UPI0021525377|nr:PhoX family protein [Nocardioides sp. B-3]